MKGLYGHGFYVELVTDTQGRGLEVADPQIPEMAWVAEMRQHQVSRVIAAKQSFRLGRDVPASSVVSRVASALMGVGWGPWVDQRGQLIVSSLAELRERDMATNDTQPVLAAPQWTRVVNDSR